MDEEKGRWWRWLFLPERRTRTKFCPNRGKRTQSDLSVIPTYVHTNVHLPLLKTRAKCPEFTVIWKGSADQSIEFLLLSQDKRKPLKKEKLSKKSCVYVWAGWLVNVGGRLLIFKRWQQLHSLLWRRNRKSVSDSLAGGRDVRCLSLLL